jgi:hypothetical protein
VIISVPGLRKIKKNKSGLSSPGDKNAAHRVGCISAVIDDIYKRYKRWR